MLRSIGKIRNDYRDNFLSEEEYQEIEPIAVKALRKKILFRKLFPEWFGTPIGWASEYGYDVNTDLSDAQIDTIFRSLNTDTLKKTRVTKTILKVEKDFYIGRWQLERAREQGRNPIQEHVESATYKVALAEDHLLLNGWAEDGTNKDIEGLYQAAGNTTAGADFGTYGNAIASALAGIALMEADLQYGPFKLLLNPVQNRELQGSYHGTSGEAETPLVNQLLNDLGYGKVGGVDDVTKRIYSMPQLTAGKGLMIGEDDAEAISIIPGRPLTVETYDWTTKDGVGVAGRVYETLLLAVKRENNLCDLTTI